MWWESLQAVNVPQLKTPDVGQFSLPYTEIYGLKDYIFMTKEIYLISTLSNTAFCCFGG